MAQSKLLAGVAGLALVGALYCWPGEDQEASNRPTISLSDVANKIQVAEATSKLVVADPGYKLPSGLHLTLTSSANAVFIGSDPAPKTLRNVETWSLEEMDGKLLPEQKTTGALVFWGALDKSNARKTLNCAEKYVLCVEEQFVELPSQCEYVILSSSEAKEVLLKGLDLAQLV